MGVKATPAPCAPAYLQAIWAERMRGLFDAKEEALVLEWLSRNWKRPRVVVVGSGFTLNAKCLPGTNIPLWSHLNKALERDLNVLPGKFDAMQLPDVHAAKYGSRDRLRALMKKQLNDAVLRPGKAHDALWESLPAAVVTTNFLDTVLEKSRPQRAQVVVSDTDLGRPIESHMRHVVYLHGHLSDEDSWVAGRQEYEALPGKRPMIHAKVRQLLAEFPALVVGYSLTDPDFHLIYGDTVRSMGDARPTGLALLPTGAAKKGKEQQTKVANELNHGYWRTQGLSLVHFCSAASAVADASYVRFFKLTERVTTLTQLLISLKKPDQARGIPATFEQNAVVGRSALDDPELAEVFRSPDSRVHWWRDVIARSLDDATRAKANEATKRTNLARHALALQDGESRRVGGRTAQPSAAPLQRAAWVKGPASWRASDAIAALLEQLDGGNEATRQLEQLLLNDAPRQFVRDWLELALNDPEFVPRVVERSYVAALALLADGSRERLRDVYHLADEHGETSVAKPILRYLGRAPRKRRQPQHGEVPKQLKRAFHFLTHGKRVQAAKLYATLHDKLLTADLSDKQGEASLLAYFAAQGVLDCTTWETSIAEVEELQRKRDVLAHEPSVRLWRDRTRALRDSVTKSKEQHQKSEQGYESHGGSWSAAPGELWYNYERATSLGAPLSIRRELLMPLLDTIPDAEHELGGGWREIVQPAKAAGFNAKLWWPST